MLQKTCTVDGVKYKAQTTLSNCSLCAGNNGTGDWNERLCTKLPDCFYPPVNPLYFINWIKVIPRKKNTATP